MSCDLCSQVWNTDRGWLALPGQARPSLQDLRQLGSKRTAGRLLAISSTALFAVGTLFGSDGIGCCGRLLRRRRATWSSRGASLPFGGCAGLARNNRSSRGARSNRRMIDCISSFVGASTNAKPLDSCVSWFRITLTASATRSSAASHCLISSAVTQVGRLPRNTVKLIQLILLLRCGFAALQGEDSDLPYR